jgi:hypothetical protein
MNAQWDGDGRSRALFAVLAVVAIGLVAFVVLRAYQSASFYFGDDYPHLLISRAAWEDPSAILSVWGRPIMTLAYMPAVRFGEGAVRLTGLVLFVGSAALCADIARRRNRPAPLLAGIFLLAQPVAARLGFGAMPQTVFSLLLALALWLYVRDRLGAAALVASLLPLARLEGLVILVVLAGILWASGEWRRIPLLGAGMVAWVATAWAVFGDPLWLLHTSPYGFLGTKYPAAGWRYVFVAFQVAVGPVMGAIVLSGLARLRWAKAPERPIALCLLLFYGIVWTLPAFESFATPIYLASLAVPFALIAHEVIVDLTEQPIGRLTAVAAVGVVAFAVLSGSRLLILFAGAMVVGLLIAQYVPSQLRMVGVAGLVLLTLVTAFRRTDPVPLKGEIRVAHDLVAELGDRSRNVRISTTPSFYWFANRPKAAYDADVRVGEWILWDSNVGPYHINEQHLLESGYRAALVRHDASVRVVLYERVSD